MPDEVTIKSPPGKGEINKENILAFLHSFKKRTGMYVAKPENYDVVSSFLRGYMYCCFMQGYPCVIDFSGFPNASEPQAPLRFIDALIGYVESET